MSTASSGRSALKRQAGSAAGRVLTVLAAVLLTLLTTPATAVADSLPLAPPATAPNDTTSTAVSATASGAVAAPSPEGTQSTAAPNTAPPAPTPPVTQPAPAATAVLPPPPPKPALQVVQSAVPPAPASPVTVEHVEQTIEPPANTAIGTVADAVKQAGPPVTSIPETVAQTELAAKPVDGIATETVATAVTGIVPEVTPPSPPPLQQPPGLPNDQSIEPPPETVEAPRPADHPPAESDEAAAPDETAASTAGARIVSESTDTAAPVQRAVSAASHPSHTAPPAVYGAECRCSEAAFERMVAAGATEAAGAAESAAGEPSAIGLLARHPSAGAADRRPAGMLGPSWILGPASQPALGMAAGPDDRPTGVPPPPGPPHAPLWPAATAAPNLSPHDGGGHESHSALLFYWSVLMLLAWRALPRYLVAIPTNRPSAVPVPPG
ncbi:MAG: hypothetical protein HY332_10615 [Chloroflexi bacterium]|nr:hypothetical protein [Chloroflexota bacterium]